MQNNYFIPDISDIRVGYEYEYIIGTVFQKVKIRNLTDPLLKNIEAAFESKVARVPYLTKEQIEAEGWELSPYSFIIMDITDKNKLGDEHM